MPEIPFKLAKHMQFLGFPLIDPDADLYPNLEYLIEQIGPSFYSLTYDDGEWIARAANRTGFGFGPKEAVANLWVCRKMNVDSLGITGE